MTDTPQLVEHFFRHEYAKLVAILCGRVGVQHIDLIETADVGPERYLPGEINDNLLRMLFVCCDDAIARESQIVLALKTQCGFSTRQIALRLFASEAKIYKRLARMSTRCDGTGGLLVD